MKRKFLIIISIFLFVIATCFYGLWQQEKNSQSELLALCQVGIADSLRAFNEFKETGQTSDYMHGVAAFNVFVKASFMMKDNTPERKNAGFLNEVYGYLAVRPDRAKDNIDEIIKVLSKVSEDMENPNGYNQMQNLRNLLGHEIPSNLHIQSTENANNSSIYIEFPKGSDYPTDIDSIKYII